MEQRNSQRVPLSFPIRLSIGRVRRHKDRTAANVSIGGVFVATDYPYPVRSKLELEFYLKPVHRMIKAQGEVVRSITKGTTGDGPPGMGIRFTHFERGARSLIELFVRKFNRYHPSETVILPESFLDEADAEIKSGWREQKPSIGIALEIRMSFLDGSKFLHQHSESLQRDEIFIRTDAPRPVGTRVRLQIVLETENECMTAEGEVVESASPKDRKIGTRRPGMTVALHETDPCFTKLIHSACP